jgi:hypothetical protein
LDEEEGRRQGEKGARSNCKNEEWDFFTAVKSIYTFTTWSRARSEIFVKPGLSGKTPEIPLPLSPACRFSRNLILDRFE